MSARGESEHGLHPTVERLFYRYYHPHAFQNEDEILDSTYRRLLSPEVRALDAGAGAGERFPNDYRSLCREIVGVDLDPRVTTNPTLHRGVVAPLDALPFPDASFDLVFSRWVFEHLPEPERVVHEIARVLRPGGRAVVITPSRFHYMTVISSLTPLRFHRGVNRVLGRKGEDVFQTAYRANTRRRLTELFRREGFETEELRQLECAPNYLVFHPGAFLLGVAYERLVNSTPWLAGLRLILLGTFRRTT